MPRNRVTKEYNLKVCYPEIAAQWHPTLNLCEPDSLGPKGNFEAWWRCVKGHEWQATVYSRTGLKTGCPYCSGKRATKEHSLAALNPELAAQWHPTKNDKGPEFYTPKSGQRVWWLCEKGHEWKTSIGNRADGTRCPFCAGKHATIALNIVVSHPSIAKDWHPTKNKLDPEKYTPTSGKRVWWQCENGHEWSATISNRTASRKSGCPSCSISFTGLERVASNLLGVQKYNLKPHPDLPYRPDFKLADTLFLNVDGLYWHSEEQKSQSYHRKMREDFEARGLTLLQFYEDEVKGKPEIVKSMVDYRLGKVTQKYAARECVISNIPPIEARNFFLNNHLMGAIGSTRCVGLTVEGRLMSALAYKLLENGTMLEVSRFATALNTSIAGGFSRLLKHLIKLTGVQTAISFCDLRYSTGKSYENAGFVRTGVTQGWCWTDGTQRYHRMRCRAGGGKTERQRAEELGWLKLFDAGQAKYVLTCPDQSRVPAST